jgi:outer membrane protein OmpA-like peptidoglycan-associated protein
MKPFACLVFGMISFLYAQPKIVFTPNNSLIDPSKTIIIDKGNNKVELKIFDLAGNPIPNIDKKDFSLDVNGQKAELIKINPTWETSKTIPEIIFCLDNSSSMEQNENKLLGIVDSLLTALPSSANISFIFFNEGGLYTKKFQNKNESDNKNKPIINKFAIDASFKISMKSFYNEKDNAKEYYHDIYKNQKTAKTYLNDQIYSAFSYVNKGKYSSDNVFYIVLSDGMDVGSKNSDRETISEYKNGKLFLIDFQQYSESNFLFSLNKKLNATYFNAKEAYQLSDYFRKIGEAIIYSGYEVIYKIKMPPELTFGDINDLENSHYIATKNITVEDAKSTEFFPLLNYLFFEKNSSDICSRYKLIKKDETVLFDEKELPLDQLQIYSNILNIVGSRLTLYKDAQITLTGCNDNSKEELIQNNLSQLRAESVQNYLVNTWGVQKERIKIKYHNLPEKPSSSKNENGIEENRRVEIISDDSRILDVIEMKAISRIINPDKLQFNLFAKTSAPVKTWKLILKQDGVKVFEKENDGDIPSTYLWNASNDLQYNRKLRPSQFEFELYAKDEDGMEGTSKIMKMPVIYTEQKNDTSRMKKQISKMSLVLFDFGSSSIGKRNESILRKIDNTVLNNSKLSVFGYTDSIGSAKGNLELSQRRADSFLNTIKKVLQPKTKDLSAQGYGEESPLYDNKYPEGRFYNRTCQLIIESKI